MDMSGAFDFGTALDKAGGHERATDSAAAFIGPVFRSLDCGKQVCVEYSHASSGSMSDDERSDLHSVGSPISSYLRLEMVVGCLVQC